MPAIARTEDAGLPPLCGVGLLRVGHFFNRVPFDIAFVQVEEVNHTLSVQVAMMLGYGRLWSACFLDGDFPMSHRLSIIRQFNIVDVAIYIIVFF